MPSGSGPAEAAAFIAGCARVSFTVAALALAGPPGPDRPPHSLGCPLQGFGMMVSPTGSPERMSRPSSAPSFRRGGFLVRCGGPGLLAA